MPLDGLRPPSELDPEAMLYKDWLHLNLFDPRTGLVGLVNVALHGAPGDPRARAVGTALMHLPGRGWVGNVETAGLDEVAVGEDGVGLSGVALAVDPQARAVIASVRLPDDGLRLDVTAGVEGPTYAAPWRLPLGSGWISWLAAPRLRPRGRVDAAGGLVNLTSAIGYHDHNWGRWRWGDDLGWEWGCFAGQAQDPVFVYTRTTDRNHRRASRPVLLVHDRTRNRKFAGRSVTVEYAGELTDPPRRVPGALAALHSDRARPRLPAEVELRADDGHDSVRVRFRALAAVQIVTAELEQPGYGFIHEIAGAFQVRGRIGGRELATEGLAMFEHVD
jgi:hypothetical protein